MTPHNKAKKQDIANVVLMPGDPLRAKWIADNFLKNTKCVNEVRNMLTYTGTYKNKKITIMPHGMGIPSIGIYSYELMSFYGVKNIIRIGSCGAISKDLKLGSIIIADNAYSESTYAKLMGLKVTNKILSASTKLVKLAEKIAKKLKINVHKNTVISEDAFYQKIYKPEQMVKKHNAIAVEMEAFGLYANALITKKQALTLLTVSDSLVTNENMSPDERATTFNEMIQLALEMGVNLSSNK